MLPLLLHLIALIYTTSSWTGKLAVYPKTAMSVWLAVTALLVLLMPKITEKITAVYAEKNEGRIESASEHLDFVKTLNIIQWAIVLWVTAVQVSAEPGKILLPALYSSYSQTISTLISAIAYFLILKPAMKNMRKLFLPILDPEQGEKEFFRARLTPFLLIFPPVLLWIFIEDSTKGGLAIVHELSLMFASPLFFIMLFIAAPKLFNMAWKAEESRDGELKQTISDLSQKTNTQITGIRIWNTFGEPLSNAAVAGFLAKFRYVYITKYMLENYSQEETKSVVAHELGHLNLGHVITYCLFSFIAVFSVIIYRVSFYLYLPEIDLSSFWPALAEGIIFVFAFIFSFAALSRYSEYQADGFSVAFCGKESFIRAIEHINYDSAPSNVPEWLRMHPTTQNRIKKISEAEEINPEKLLHKSRNIRYAMIAAVILLSITACLLARPIKDINKLFNAVKAGNAKLAEERCKTLPRWLRKHPKVIEILKGISSSGCARSCS